MGRIDLHVHTRRYSDCAEFLAPEDIGQAMLCTGLDGVLITEHDARWRAAEAERLRGTCPEKHFYFGVEISACDGHVVAVGIPDQFRWDPRQTVAALVDGLALAGACAIWVHPYRRPMRWTAPPKKAHAIEVYSTVTVGTLSDKAQDLARDLGVWSVAGSDAHAIDHIGTAWVEFEGMPTDEQELATWIREGRARPSHGNGAHEGGPGGP